jgi:hypothetical protein
MIFGAYARSSKAWSFSSSVNFGSSVAIAIFEKISKIKKHNRIVCLGYFLKKKGSLSCL